MNPGFDPEMIFDHSAELPDLFRFEKGDPVETDSDWKLRREELLGIIQNIEYGEIPECTQKLASAMVSSEAFENPACTRQCIKLTIHSEPKIEFEINLRIPKGEGPFPVIINGDDCWGYVTREIEEAVLSRNCILATFDREKIAIDTEDTHSRSAIFQVYSDIEFGAVSAWAWGYLRCIDFLEERGDVDHSKIAVTGHSRGGKAVLLAGAVDERIALTAPNDSGCGGAGCFRIQGPSSEKLENIIGGFPHWFSDKLTAFIGKESELPFDQHSLKACIAPRAYLSTEALEDLWANPSGTWASHQAALPGFKRLGAEDKAGIHFRRGGHAHELSDWEVLLDFLDWQFREVTPINRFNELPAGWQ